MDSEREDEHGSRSLARSEASFTEDETQSHSGPKSSDEKDLESTCLKDSELSPNDELSGKENSCLISPLSNSKPLAFDVHIKEVPRDAKASFQDVLTPPGISNIGDAFPVCVQLPANHLQKSHINPYKTSHRHHRISQSSTSTSMSLSLKAPVEDLCASFLLACLFCRFWDCVVAVGDGCQLCLASLCSSLVSTACGCCDPSSLELLLDVCPCCGCGCAELVQACGCSWGESALDCSACDLCLQTSECLELGMELSQLLFH